MKRMNDKNEVKSPRQRRYTLTILELFAKPNRDLITAWLSEKSKMDVKGVSFTRIHCAAIPTA